MAENSKIEWTTHTFNPWIGCVRVSPGCQHCYAEALARRTGLVEWGQGKGRHVTSDAYWRKPLRWDRDAARSGARPRVFCASLADVFEDRVDLDGPRRRLAQLIWHTPYLDWLLLTKRPENARQMIYEMWFPDASWPQNVWVGTSVEDRRRAEERIPALLKVPASVRFLSCEPLLEDPGPLDLFGIDWVIIGGESGPGARPFDPDWARAVIARCREAGVAAFMKQMGSVWARANRSGDSKGGDPADWDEDLRVREFPVTAPMGA